MMEILRMEEVRDKELHDCVVVNSILVGCRIRGGQSYAGHYQDAYIEDGELHNTQLISGKVWFISESRWQLFKRLVRGQRQPQPILNTRLSVSHVQEQTPDVPSPEKSSPTSPEDG